MLKPFADYRLSLHGWLFASVVIPLLAALTGCFWHGVVELEKLHVRGEYNFNNHIIKDCESGVSYDLVMGSAGGFELSERFEKLGMKPDDSPETFPVIMEFDAVVTYYQMPFAKRRSIACAERPQITRGRCTSAGNASNQTMKPTRPLQENLSEIATTPSRGLSLSR